MWAIGWLWVLAGWLLAALWPHWAQKGPALCLCQGDSDMKIAGGRWSARPREEGNAVARDYLAQRELGNIQRAKQLGEEFACLVEQWGDRQDGAEAPPFAHAYYCMLAFGVNQAVEHFFPNSILAQTALSAFYDRLGSCCPACSKAAGDSAAFSLFLLAIRGRQPAQQAVGGVFAELCGRQEAAAWAAGQYGSFLAQLQQMVQLAGFVLPDGKE